MVHEYSALDGVQEDVVDILLNLKGIVLKLHNSTEAVLILKKKGEGVATAGDIEVGHDVARIIVNMAFALTLGSVAVAVALSFGLGGREAAGKQMEYWLAKTRD